jgi:uncharacterized protein YunC (DUF1805 family)
MRRASYVAMGWVMCVAGCGGCGGGGGGGGGDADSASSTPATADAMAYPRSVELGNTSAVALSVVPATTTSTATLESPVAAPLTVAGNTALVSLHQQNGYAGAGIACVSASANSVGTVTNVNVGVNVKSVAALLDATWTSVTNPVSTWNSFGANGKVFDGWENCGAKAEGGPSPSSTLIVHADGSFSDNVFDGNPATTVHIVDQGFDPTQAAAMLSDAGLLDTSQPTNPQIIRLAIYRNAAGQALLVEQAIPTAGASNATPGYVAVYFAR